MLVHIRNSALGIFLALVLTLILSACGPEHEGPLSGVGMGYHHDNVHKVGCWTNNQAISCLPDSAYTVK